VSCLFREHLLIVAVSCCSEKLVVETGGSSEIQRKGLLPLKPLPNNCTKDVTMDISACACACARTRVCVRVTFYTNVKSRVAQETSK
jgi:hypothetical protein